MAAIHDLLAQIGDARLRDRITAEWAKATRDRKFGLVFEDHLPELLPLPKARPRKGDLVCPRGGSLNDLWRVQGFAGGLYDQHKKTISRMPEARRRLYDRLRLATAQPADVPWMLPDSIDWRRVEGEMPQDLHLYVGASGGFACKLLGWEPDVLAEELMRGDVLGWLRNLPHKPWSLEIPCEAGAEVRPMFPDFVLVRRLDSGLVVDILEPHDPSRDDNVDKARALARFAERHGGQFGRIQLIRKRRTAGGGAQFVRLEINRRDAWQQVLLVTTAAQLDRLFQGDH